MKTKMTAAALALFLAIAVPGSAAAQQNSPTSPAAIGAPVRSAVELGSVYSSLYDITVTVLETVRGKEAMNRLKAADASNPAPKAGYEYLLARVKFEIKGRAITDTRAIDLGSSPLQWVAFAEDLTEYENVSVTVPKPELTAELRSGQTTEGWLAFAVQQKDAKPIMTFDPDSGGANGRGKILFFKLY